jgi:hypothetical protein
MSSSTWQGRRRGWLPFSRWANEWWAVWSTDPMRSPTMLAATEIRLRRHVRPFFGDRPIEAIQPMLIRTWQNRLPGKLGYESLMACRSILFRILQLAEDEVAAESATARSAPRRPRCAELLGVDLASLREAAAKVEPYTRADGARIWSLVLMSTTVIASSRSAPSSPATCSRSSPPTTAPSPCSAAETRCAAMPSCSA